MEEKLYFRPANYGKGLKKHKEKPASAEKQTDSRKNHKTLKLGGFLLFLTIIVVVIIWLLRGKTTTTGQYPENIKKEALICESSGISYPKITRTDSSTKSLRVNLLFNNDDELRNASLTYTLYYDNEDEVKRAEAFAHADFNYSLYDNDYAVTKFNNKFACYSDRLIMSLYADSSDIDEYTAQYFFIEQKDYKLPTTISEYKETYEAQGFSCASTTE